MSSPSLWRNAEFTKLWAGYSIARVGSQITVLALPLTAVLLLGAGATETGLLVAAQMAPSIVAGASSGGGGARPPPPPLPGRSRIVSPPRSRDWSPPPAPGPPR